MSKIESSNLSKSTTFQKTEILLLSPIRLLLSKQNILFFYVGK